MRHIYPDMAASHGADVRSWVRANRAEVDAPLWRAVSRWIREAWPFEDVTYATPEP